MKYKVPFIKPSFPSADDIGKDYLEILESNWYTNFGPFESKLCKAVQDLFPQECFVTTIANATLGLQAAVDILIKPVGKQKEVLVPSFTFAAGPLVIIRAGLKPVFIDIDHQNWQPDLTQAKSYVEDNPGKVAGILLCNIFGVGNQQIEKWEELAKKHGLPLIIDSAAGFGSMYDEIEKIGLRGSCEIFSLHATKPFSVGEGGLIVSKDQQLIEHIRSYQNFGFGQDKQIGHIGTNGKLQELNCAIGIRQLKEFESRLSNRRVTLKKYKASLPKLRFMENDELSTVAFASAALPPGIHADKIIKILHEVGVEARRYYAPLHKQIKLRKYNKKSLSLANTEDIAKRIISLPVHDSMSDDDRGLVVNSLRLSL